MAALNSSLLLVLALLLVAHPRNMAGVEGAHEETVCDAQDIEITQVLRPSFGIYIVTVTNKCYNQKAGCEPRNLRVSCPDYKPTYGDLDKRLFHRKRGTDVCIVNNKKPITEPIVFNYAQAHQATLTPLSVDYLCCRRF